MATIRLSILLLLFQVFSVCAQQQLGLVIDGNLNMHSADFRAFPGVPSCCPKYQSGSGSSLGLGLLGSIKISTESWCSARIQYNSYSARLVRTESLVLAGNTPGEVEHSVDCVLPALELDLLFRQELGGGLSAEIGPRFGHFLSPTFTQKELVVSPSTGSFENGSRSRNELVDADIPDLSSLHLGFNVGLVYSTPLNATGSLLLQPELRYVLGLSSIVRSMDWKASQVQAGLRFVWAPQKTKEIPQRAPVKIERIDTTRIQGSQDIARYIRGKERIVEDSETENGISTPRELTLRTDTIFLPRVAVAQSFRAPIIRVDILDSARNVVSGNSVQVEEFASFPTTPLLAHVFFDENSSKIPARYRILNNDNTGQFSEEKLQNRDRLQCYYDVLNIVASRMIAHPKAELRLVGCNADLGPEKANNALSMQRAQSVRDYLVSVWKIPSKRIKLDARNLPVRAANSLSTDGAQENRRVELIADDASILAPIDSKDTLRVLRTPYFRIVVENVPLSSNARSEILIQQGSRTIAQMDLAKKNPAEVEWNAAEVIAATTKQNESLNCIFRSNDTAATASANSVRIPLEVRSVQQKRSQHIADEEITRYSLMMFDVRSAEITDANKALVSIIRKQLQPGAKISVIGYADRSGDTRLNQQLALERAQSMARELGLGADADVQGQLDSVSYDQNLPEGRLYSRTVDIVVRSRVRE